MSRTFLALLLLSSVVAAQPLEGPFDVMAVDSGLHIATPCLAAHDSVIEIFYTLHSPGANEVQRIVYNLETHQTIGDPVTMRHDTAWDQRLVNAEIQPNGDRAVMVNLVGNSCSGVLCLLETASGVRDFVLEEGCWVQGDYWFLSSWFTYHHVRRVPGGRFVAAWVWNGFYGFEYIESVWEGRIAYFSGDSLEAVQEVLPDSMIYGSDVLAIAPLAFDRTLALMRGSFVGPSTLAVVPRSSDPFFGAGVELPCDMLPLDFRLTPGGRMIALSRDSSESLTPAVFEVDTLGNCTQLGSLTWNRRPGSPAWHPNWGWVIPYQETCCLLVGRLDTLGQEVQPVGVIFERDSVWAIVEACASISDDGRIVAVWSERRTRMPRG
jgi:hypothetical protein